MFLREGLQPLTVCAITNLHPVSLQTYLFRMQARYLNIWGEKMTQPSVTPLPTDKYLRKRGEKRTMVGHREERPARLISQYEQRFSLSQTVFLPQ